MCVQPCPSAAQGIGRKPVLRQRRDVEVAWGRVVKKTVLQGATIQRSRTVCVPRMLSAARLYGTRSVRTMPVTRAHRVVEMGSAERVRTGVLVLPIVPRRAVEMRSVIRQKAVLLVQQIVGFAKAIAASKIQPPGVKSPE